MSLPGTADMVSMCGEEAPIQWADVCGEGTWEAAVEMVSVGTSEVEQVDFEVAAVWEQGVMEACIPLAGLLQLRAAAHKRESSTRCYAIV